MAVKINSLTYTQIVNSPLLVLMLWVSYPTIRPVSIAEEFGRRVAVDFVLPPDQAIVADDEVSGTALGGVHGALPTSGTQLQLVVFAVGETVEEHQKSTVMRTDKLRWKTTCTLSVHSSLLEKVLFALS